MEPLDTSLVEPPVNELYVSYGGFWFRFWALIIDYLVLIPVSIALTFNNLSWRSVPLTVTLWLVAIIYKPLMEYKYGATLGKMALRLTVVNRKYQKINFTEAFLRDIFNISRSILSLVIYLGFYSSYGYSTVNSFYGFNQFRVGGYSGSFISVAFVFTVIVDAIFLIADSRKRALHDLIAGTFVILK